MCMHTHTHTAHAQAHIHTNANTRLTYIVGICDTYVSIWQYIDTVIEYYVMILCSMSIEIWKWLYKLSDESLL